jgi:hypothetical protein
MARHGTGWPNAAIRPRTHPDRTDRPTDPYQPSPAARPVPTARLGLVSAGCAGAGRSISAALASRPAMAARALSLRGERGRAHGLADRGPDEIGAPAAGVRRRGTGKAGVRWPAAEGACRRASACDAAHARPGIRGVSWGAAPFAGLGRRHRRPRRSACRFAPHSRAAGYAAASQATIAVRGSPLTRARSGGRVRLACSVRDGFMGWPPVAAGGPSGGADLPVRVSVGAGHRRPVTPLRGGCRVSASGSAARS